MNVSYEFLLVLNIIMIVLLLVIILHEIEEITILILDFYEKHNQYLILGPINKANIPFFLTNNFNSRTTRHRDNWIGLRVN